MSKPVYKCTQCGKNCKRERLVVKRVQYTGMGKGARLLRSRTLAWLCPTCLRADPPYQQEAFETPGVN